MEVQGMVLVLVSLSDMAAWVKAGTDNQTGSPAGATGALWVLGNVTFLLLTLWDFCRLFQASNNSLKLCKKISFHLIVSLGCLMTPVMTRAGMCSVCSPTIPVSVSDPGSAL